LWEQLFQGVCLVAALAVPGLVTLLVLSLFQQSWLAIRTLGPQFLISTAWAPNRGEFGAVSFIYGTLTTSAIAMLLAVPLGVGAAAFLSEVATGWVRRASSFLIELLAAIPSVVYGFWGIFFLAPLIQHFFNALGGPNRGGSGILSAGVILAIMVVPYITAISYDVCQAVPKSQREGSLALGATRWQTIRSVVLPYARPGIVGGCFLALGRALGETMAVVMLIGNSAQVQFSLYALGYSIPSVIANELGTAQSELHKSVLIELGLVLFLVSVIVNSLARMLIWRVGTSRDNRLLRRWFKVRPSSAVAQPHMNSALQAPHRNSAPADRLMERVPEGRQRLNQLINRFMTVVLGGCLVITLVPLFHILGYITFRGLDSVNRAFFTNLPVDEPPGLGNALVGSAMMVGLATLCAVPIGILAAIYLAEFHTHRLVPVVRFVGELLGGVPSIIIGVFAYAVLVTRYGYSGWAGSFALGVMMIPIVMRASEEALKLVPNSLRTASYALGATHSQTVARVIVPAALPAIITAVFLAIARIAGETAPLLFTASSKYFWPKSFSEETPFLTYYIYTYATSESAAEQRQAWAGALVLLALVMLLNIGIRLATGKRLVLASRAD
jgi:phosphate transport system permease protein